MSIDRNAFPSEWELDEWEKKQKESRRRNRSNKASSQTEDEQRPDNREAWALQEDRHCEAYPLGLDIQIQRDVDRALWEQENVITTDSVILDHCVSWVNLAAECLKETGAQCVRLWDDGMEEDP